MRPLTTLLARLMLALAVAGPVLALAQPAAAYYDDEEEIELSVFDEDDGLRRYGSWTTHPRWGRVWYPSRVDRSWRPYTRGHWSHTDNHGWYWVSDEPFGWAVYHYGRWTLDDDDRWIWIPGRRWGPAWVTWRHGGEHIGWAPLPPEAVWDPGYGVRYSATYYDSPRFSRLWCFVGAGFLTVPGLYRYAVPYHRNVTFIRSTTIVNHYTFVNRRIVNHGIAVRDVERLGRRPIRSVRIEHVQDPRRHGHVRGEPGVIRDYRPTRGSANLGPGRGEGPRQPGLGNIPNTTQPRFGGDQPGPRSGLNHDGPRGGQRDQGTPRANTLPPGYGQVPLPGVPSTQGGGGLGRGDTRHDDAQPGRPRQGAIPDGSGPRGMGPRGDGPPRGDGVPRNLGDGRGQGGPRDMQQGGRGEGPRGDARGLGRGGGQPQQPPHQPQAQPRDRDGDGRPDGGRQR